MSMSKMNVSSILYPIVGLVLIVVVMLVLSTSGIISNSDVNDALGDSSIEIVSMIGVLSLIIVGAVITKKR